MRWAIDGGLKEESRMYSVRGCVEVALTVRTTRNLEAEDVKEFKADSRSGKSARMEDIREAISAIGGLGRMCSKLEAQLPSGGPFVIGACRPRPISKLSTTPSTLTFRLSYMSLGRDYYKPHARYKFEVLTE